jgi:hypothetical protein
MQRARKNGYTHFEKLDMALPVDEGYLGIAAHIT